MAIPLMPPPSVVPDAGVEAPGRRRADVAASATIVLVAIVAVALSWFQPWWVMKARAPQYGQRTLVVEFGLRDVQGDVREVDLPGHYVGIQPMGGLARVERALAPIGVLLAIAGLLVAPWMRRRRWRLLMVVPAALMPIGTDPVRPRCLRTLSHAHQPAGVRR